MAKFIIQKDFSFGTYVPKRLGIPSRLVNFKKGDIVEGNIIRNENIQAMAVGAEASEFVETQTAQGMVRIPYGFRGVPFLIVIPGTIEGNEGVPKPKVNPNTTETPEILTETNKATETKWFTTKNIVIGVLVIVGIYVFLKWKKMI